jgi:hypothetical protein
MALAGPAGLAALLRTPAGPADGDTAAGGSDRDAAGDVELAVRGFGDGAELAPRLAAQVRAWAAHGRPGTGQLRVRAYPVGSRPPRSGPVLVKRYTELELDWAAQPPARPDGGG